jgi:hypothetical protein
MARAGRQPFNEAKIQREPSITNDSLNETALSRDSSGKA